MANFPRIFSTESAKAIKASGFGYLNAIHYMAPASTGGFGNLCAGASVECIKLCLGTYSGQAAMVADLESGTNSVRESRKNKARLFMTRRAEYLNAMALESCKIIKRARAESLIPCMRLNGSTDVPYERIRFIPTASTLKALAKIGYNVESGERVTLLDIFHDIQFVDYTKIPNRLTGKPNNLDLTLSYSVRNSRDCVNALLSGHNVAIVFHGGLPESFGGFPVIDGDKHDLRHLDEKGGFIVGLSPKGQKAKKDNSGFVVPWAERAGRVLASQWIAIARDINAQSAPIVEREKESA